MHDRNVRNDDEIVQAMTSLHEDDVTQRTRDPLARVEKHVDSATIARKLGCSTDFVNDEMTRGHLPYLKIGRKRVVPISAVEAYVAARAIGNHPARRTAPTSIVGLKPPNRRTA